MKEGKRESVCISKSYHFAKSIFKVFSMIF